MTKIVAISSVIFAAVLVTSVNGCAQNNSEPEPRQQENAAIPEDQESSSPEESAVNSQQPPENGASKKPDVPREKGKRKSDSGAQLQVGPWSPFPGNIEAPFINIVHASSVSWQGDGYTTKQLYDGGFIDKTTGLPVRFPRGVSSLTAGQVYFPAPVEEWDGEWILEWDGPADIKLAFLPDALQRRVSPNRVEFTRDAAGGRSPYHAQIRINRLDGPITGLRMYRAEHEAALKAGKVYNPQFADMISRNHIVRTMDIQEANRATIRGIGELATDKAAFWNNLDWLTWPRELHHPFRSVPLSAVFALAMETDTALWHHAPLTLGAPIDLHDSSVFDPAFFDKQDRTDKWSSSFYTENKKHTSEILASREWDRYADAFVAALIDSGYPSDRTLYTTLDNEVWNWSGYYFNSTKYAAAIGDTLFGKDNQYRRGYGVLLARWAQALDAALVRAGRSQDIVYVVEGQAANPDTTFQALAGMKNRVEAQGGSWAALSPRLGVSVASYWGGQGYYHLFSDVAPHDLPALRARFSAEVSTDPNGLARRLADFYINGPDNVVATKAWVLKMFAAHQAVAEKVGVRVIGAYEGGSHDDAPTYFRKSFGDDSEILRAWRTRYLWGPEGARVNTAVNDALAEAYPGIILSNYGTIGQTGGQPWFEGRYGENNDMSLSWTRYHRR